MIFLEKVPAGDLLDAMWDTVYAAFLFVCLFVCHSNVAPTFFFG